MLLWVEETPEASTLQETTTATDSTGTASSMKDAAVEWETETEVETWGTRVGI